MARGSAMCVFGVLVTVLAMAVAGPTLAKVGTDGLLGLWMMDDDGGQEAEDSSGNENHMGFDAGGGDWVDGKFGGAIEFDAAGFMDAEAPLLPETRGFTMGCWIKPGSEQKAFTNIMSSHQEPPQRGISFEQNNLEHNSYGVAMGAGQWMGCGNTQFFMDEGEWGHMTIVREDDGVFAHAYKNGEAFSKDQICGADDPIIEPTSNFRIGNWVLGGREYDGLVDEAFLFDRAISAANVKEIAEKGWEGALGVEPGGKMTTTWASMKTVQ